MQKHLERSDMSATDDVKPHVFDPATHPEYFSGVLSRRALAFLIDATIIVALTAIGYVALGVIGIITLGLAWLLFGAVFPLVAITYTALGLSSPASATIGMRVMGLEMRLWYGARPYFALAAVHVILFYILVTILTPLVLLVGLFNDRRRLLHDLLIGTVVINAPDKRRA